MSDTHAGASVDIDIRKIYKKMLRLAHHWHPRWSLTRRQRWAWKVTYDAIS